MAAQEPKKDGERGGQGLAPTAIPTTIRYRKVRSGDSRMEWKDIKNNHIRDVADRLSETVLALEEVIRPLTFDGEWQEDLDDHGLAFIEGMVLRVHRIADDLEASLEEGRDIDGEDEDE